MLNTITLNGRLTHGVDLRTTNSGKPVSDFSIAVERDYKNESGEREVDFFDCIAWGKLGEFVSNFFDKGDSVIISGRLQTRKYEDINGVKRTVVEIVCSDVYFGQAKAQEEKNKSKSKSKYYR